MADVMAIPNQASLIHILLVEDSISDALLVRRALASATQAPFHVQHVTSLNAALQAIGEKEYDVVLLDLSLPDSAEFDGLLSLQQLAPKLPVVILTGQSDEEMALKAVVCGAQDYLFKDKADGLAIIRAMQYARKRKQFEATLITQANFDTLTGLANRVLFESRLDMALARIRRTGAGLGVFFLDLNRFKSVNDTMGHSAGDSLLQQVAQQLKLCLRPYDTAARFGGDEFALLIEGIAQPRDCASIAQKIIGRLAAPFSLCGRMAEIGVSIGVAVCMAAEDADRETLMRHADEAMYDAKQSAESAYRFYTPEIQKQAFIRMRLEDELRVAIAADQLVLHYQPKMDLQSGHTIGVEALLRWKHPARGLLLPAEFIAIAEEMGLAGEIGFWVIKTICSDMLRWKQSAVPIVPVSINLFASQLDDPHFTRNLRALLYGFSFPPSLMALEIPGDALLIRPSERMKMLQQVRALGVEVHLDHMGQSAIALEAFQTACVSALKISRELTQAVGKALDTQPMVQAIMDIASHFGMDVVAIGIENEWQRAFFRDHDCRHGQGVALCRPMPSEYLPEWLKIKHK